jgi:hypothetical protein
MENPVNPLITTNTSVESEEDKALAESLRVKLTALVSQPMTSRTLLMLEQTARIARELICIGKDAKSLNRKTPYYAGSYPMLDEIDSGEPLAPAPKAETFGATLIREFVAAKNTAPPMTPMEMIGAIALAKEKGLTEIAVKLEEKLLSTPESIKEESKALPAATPMQHDHAH